MQFTRKLQRLVTSNFAHQWWPTRSPELCLFNLPPSLTSLSFLDPNQLLNHAFYNQQSSLIWIISASANSHYDEPIAIRRHLWTYSSETFLVTQYYFYHSVFWESWSVYAFSLCTFLSRKCMTTKHPIRIKHDAQSPLSSCLIRGFLLLKICYTNTSISWVVINNAYKFQACVVDE